MAINSYTWDLDTLGTSTLQVLQPVMADTIFKLNPTSAMMRRKGGIKFQDGGLFIQSNLLYQKNTTIASYKGADTLNVNPTEELTAARFGWRQAAGSITLVGLEELQNAGKYALINVLKTKIENLKNSFAEWYNEMLFLPSASKDLSRDILGFQQIIVNAAGSSQGSLGGISKNTYSWWQNKRATVTGAGVAHSAQVLTKALISFVTLCSEGINKPDILITDRETYDNYGFEQIAIGRYPIVDTKTFNIGFDNQMVRGVPMLWDAHAPSGLVYGVNFDAMHAVIHTRRNFKPMPFHTPHNQDVKTSQTLFAGNTVCRNSRFLGVLDATGLTYA